MHGYPLTKANGDPRQIGVELELAGLDLKDLSELLVDTVGGELERRSDYEAVLRGSSLGSIRIEFDAAMFRELKVRRFLKEWDPGWREAFDPASWERTLASLAQWLVPFELVFDPLPPARLPELEALRRALSGRALGTSSSPLYAFGLHLNVEPPDLEATTILRYIRAFLLLYEELKLRHDINPTRAWSGFIAPFPRDYVLLVLDARYAPNRDELIADYLTFNPTRNRPLDLLPLFCHLAPHRVRASLPEEKIHPRPAFHYRLPDCRVDESDWTITGEWEIWKRVERLAHDQANLAKRCRYELQRLRGPLWYWLRRLWRTKPILSRRPVIAVTGPDRGGLIAWICTWFALKRAGARAIWLRPETFRDDPSLPPFDGLILGGGADIDPGRYQPDFESLMADPVDEEPASSPEARQRYRRWVRWIAAALYSLRRTFALTSRVVDVERGEFEQTCVEKAFRERLPILGICRGAQFLNVALGGDLHPEVATFYGEVDHPSTLLPLHPIDIDGGSHLQAILSRPSLRVNSLHHQAIGRLGQGLRVSARDRAGVVQAVESIEHPLWLGVQWHPEYLPLSRIQQRLFKNLVQQALAGKR